MTERPVFDSPREADGDAIVRALGAARRRLRTVTMLRLGALAAPGGAAMGAGLALAGWAPSWTPVALGALGAAGAGVWAAAHTPMVSTVARILDAHLDLRDRVSAALQLRQTGGPIAALVARDAAARLARVDLTALFPLAIGRAPVAVTAVAVAMVGWLAAGGANGREPATAPGAAGGSASQSSDAVARTRAGAGTSAPEAARQAAGRRSVLERREAGRAPTDGSPRAASDAASSRPAPVDPLPATGVRGRPAGPAPGGQRTEAASMASAASGASGRGAAAGGTVRGAMSSGAGGVSGQALAPSATTGGTMRPASSLGAARAQAEAALARDVIPPDHRDHVRAYFRAIGAGTSAGGAR